MLIFLIVKTQVLLEIIPSTEATRATEYTCFMLLLPIFFFLVKDFAFMNKSAADLGKYQKKLNDILISQSQNELFYHGDTANGAKALTMEVCESTKVDRASIWLYTENKESIICESLYLNETNEWDYGIELMESDYPDYFKALELDPVIVANLAEMHEATKCFTETYLRPLGIKSMLDVPIIYAGDVIGVICIESLVPRTWKEVEINFAKLIASLYAFAHSVKLGNIHQEEIAKKNTYLEHAAKIIRHDMHSGINTYIPRGITSLERRLTKKQISELKIETPIKMIKEGLKHTQKVYKGVYEFTNLVKRDSELETSLCDVQHSLDEFLSATVYKSQVEICNIGELEINESLFCTAIDNLIRNGLKYNDSDNKKVKIYREHNTIFVEDNGRGMSSDDFKVLGKPYTRKEGQKESGSGLGLNICIAILEEHGFTLSCEKLTPIGTRVIINIKKNEDKK